MIEAILSRLNKVKKSHGRANQWLACCPAHEDRSPSLSIMQNETGKVFIHCFAGCEGSAIMNAIGMTLADLYPDPIEPSRGLGKKPQFNAYDVLAAIAAESLLVAHLGSALQEYPLCDADRERLLVAVKRIRTACGLVGVHRG